MRKLVLLLCPTLCFAGNIDVAFSPDQGSLQLVLKAINSAKRSICMATYSFTSKPVAEALLAAQKRGVKVQIVADQKSNSGKYTATQFLANQELAVRLNGSYAIMHNKFMVIDNETVETGSFNYSAAAVKKNAENVIVLWNNPEIAAKYSKECNRLYNQAAVTLTKKY